MLGEVVVDEKSVCLITGSSRGIGAEIAKRFAKEQRNLILNCSNEKTREQFLTPLKKECESYGVRVCDFVADVSKFEECEAMIKFAISEFKRIDFLINNAGITKDSLIARMQPSDFDSVCDVNLKGVFNMTKLVSSVMSKQKSGRIVNISSVVGVKGNAGQFNYAATKAGIIGMTKSAAKELGKRGILVNAVAPGFIETDMTDKINENFKEQIKDRIVLKRFGKAQEVAAVVSFLCSKDSSYITGQVIVVDGCLLI